MSHKDTKLAAPMTPEAASFGRRWRELGREILGGRKYEGHSIAIQRTNDLLQVGLLLA
jgi:hypothetical protein